nr:B3 domain-containing protein REM2-like [Tanacetum cinerariifolium]
VRPDAMGRMSLSVIMKCTAAIRQLAYGTTPDAFDDYLQMSANNDINVLHNSPLFDDILDDKAPIAPYVRTWVERCETQRQKEKEIRDQEMHLSLQRNLIEHIWQKVEHDDEDF